jgi:3-hydroxyisobutyrate dehydrogenase-like beta-hydroxyacid dehydrogenase
MKEVAFIGAGSMGQPMVERLLGGGVPVRLHARRDEVRDRFAGLGATVVDTPADAVKGLDICFLCLFSADQVEDVAPEVIANLPGGGLLVVHTTVPPETLDRLAEAAAVRNVRIVDAPISGTADAIRAGKLTVLFGAAQADVDRCAEAVGTYAATMMRIGELGAATRVKLINNLTFAAHAQIAESAVRLGERFGIAAADLVAAIGACSGDSVVFSHLRASGTDVLAKSVRYLRKDVAAVERAAANSGTDLGLLREVAGSGPLRLTD